MRQVAEADLGKVSLSRNFGPHLRQFDDDTSGFAILCKIAHTRTKAPARQMWRQPGDLPGQADKSEQCRPDILLPDERSYGLSRALLLSLSGCLS
jgi:hypothetical protein